MISEIKNIKEIEDLIIAYANGQFHKRLNYAGNNEDVQVLLGGINMLGEELETRTISRDYFSNIYNSVSDILIVSKPNGQITDANLAALNTLTLSHKQITSKSIQELFNVEEYNIPEDLGEKTPIDKLKSFEVEISKNASKFILQCTISRINDRNGLFTGYLLKAKNITEERLHEQTKLKIAVNAQEKERKRLANDLHDALGQEINAVKMHLNSLEFMNQNDENYGTTLSSCQTLLDNSIETIRNITFNLMPQSLQKGGTIAAVDELIKKLAPICQITFDHRNIKLKLPSEKQVILYRIIQEFINNSLKHSKCNLIRISFLKRRENVSFYINDNGKGFDYHKVTMGNGLININYRLNLLKAKYKFTSYKNSGTYLEATFKDEEN